MLYIAAKAPESLPIDDDYDDALYRDILMNIVFSYSSSPEQLINFFLDMRQYNPKPEVIIIDFLHTFFGDSSALDTNCGLHGNFIDSHMLITAALHSVVDMFCIGNDTKLISIVCIDPQQHQIYLRFIQKYVDLYYYKDHAIVSFADLMAKFPQ